MMRRALMVAAALAMLAGCRRAPAEPSPSPSVTPSAPVAVVTPPPAAPGEPEIEEDPATIVRTYFALIEGGEYARAWQLWDDEGSASGMTEAAFAASFAKFSDYRATIGTPGRVDSGAGQRYVTVPVEVAATLAASGASARLVGDVTLHKSGDIDCATAAQRSWRVYQSALKPVPRGSGG